VSLECGQQYPRECFKQVSSWDTSGHGGADNRIGDDACTNLGISFISLILGLTVRILVLIIEINMRAQNSCLGNMFGSFFMVVRILDLIN
jgi:hypothetical protein